MTKPLIIFTCLVLVYIEAFQCFTVNKDSPPMSLKEFIATVENSPQMRYYHQIAKQYRLGAVLSAMFANKTLWKIVQEEQKALGFQEYMNMGGIDPKFDCKVFHKNTTSKTVHKLTPGDIDVIAAVGDSLTAGTGITAKTVIGLLSQDRGQVYGMGGVGDINSNPTLPNILRLYNKNLKGFSTGTGSATSCNAHLDLAVPGANSLDLLQQTKDLISRMKSDKSINFNEDWKIISVFMGNNDLCDFCEASPGELSPQNYKRRVQVALDLLHKEVPRAFVNLIQIINVYNIVELNIGLVCTSLHHFECKCSAFPKNATAVKIMNKQFQEELENLVATGRYDTKDDFTVVIQPFPQETKIPKTPEGKADLSYFSTDCFHFNIKGHQQTALSLWNNMLEPVGQKRKSWHVNEPYECPTPDKPYFTTAKNSKIGFPNFPKFKIEYLP